MKQWWIRPVVRLLAAMLLPVVVPAMITGFIWALPGDPASLICPPNVCGTEVLARRWNLDGGATQFFVVWISDAFSLDFGNSWRLHQGMPVLDLLKESIPNTLALISMSTVMVMLGGVLAATNILPRKLDPAIRFIGPGDR